ncbi:MAG: hypothetical protein JNJ46_25545 [Myxococcales bacterium]|nr:hypothetical protein [Myxococcales bacterium]
MSDFILVDGDKVLFLLMFGQAMVWGPSGKLKGSGPGTLNGKKICVVGDEESVEVANCGYLTSQYCIPGKGTVKIDSLASNQKARKTRTGQKAVLLKGNLFSAVFSVQTPAKQPPPGPGSPIPDPTTEYFGQGMFSTTNRKFTGA